MANNRKGYLGYRSMLRRAKISAALILIILGFGTIALHYIEHYSYVDAFYFMSMLATAQGPSIAPSTTVGKLFVAVMAFVSVGTVITALAFLLGPFLARLIKVEEERIMKEEREFGQRMKRYEKEA